MTYSIRIFEVAPTKDDRDLIAAFRASDVLRELSPSSNQPGFIANNLLQSYNSPGCFVSIDFPTSQDAFVRSQKTPERVILRNLIQKSAIFCQDLGVFSFPSWVPEEGFCGDSSSTAGVPNLRLLQL